MRRSTLILLSAAFLIISVRLAISDSKTEAHVEFGSDHVGSPFDPPSGHDASSHAKDSVRPRTTVLAAGGEIEFEIYPFHQVAIYEPGTNPEDIDVETLLDLNVPCEPFTIPDFVFDDPEGRILLSPPATCEETEWTTPPGTFDRPGRYLIVCTTLPHFVEFDMYGWVIVK
jgi:hypothetical protein